MLLLTQDSLLRVLDDVDPAGLSHVMWAIARLDKYPSPGVTDSLLSTLGRQIDDTEPAVSLGKSGPFARKQVLTLSDVLVEHANDSNTLDDR